MSPASYCRHAGLHQPSSTHASITSRSSTSLCPVCTRSAASPPPHHLYHHGLITSTPREAPELLDFPAFRGMGLSYAIHLPPTWFRWVILLEALIDSLCLNAIHRAAPLVYTRGRDMNFQDYTEAEADGCLVDDTNILR
ncbi:hypothetical protein RRG08_039895 [Elysia crispata]|uniref:Uncharacterized protein n=1 Tax=Elysia crispata TaxID=231223 RepID=A0AAE1DMR6_9GAST|nr:hypothetical protein RRG08_039895 [Elysia crispata]